MGEISAAILCLIFLGFIFCAIIMKYDKEEKKLKREQEFAEQKQEAENRKMAAIQEESEILSCVPHILIPLIQSHRSEYDCLATGRLFERLVDDIVD